MKKADKYLNELKKMFQIVGVNKFKMLEPHLRNIAFMKAKLEELEVMIEEDGLVETYQNGENQFGKKPSTAVKTYNDIIKSFVNETKFVESYLPADSKESKLSMLSKLDA